VNESQIRSLAAQGQPVADAIVYHVDVDGCCTWTTPCDEAARTLVPFLGQATGPARAETEVQQPGSGISPAAGSLQSNQYGTFKVHSASPAQIRFLQNLLKQRDLTAATEIQRAAIEGARSGIESGSLNKKRASLVLDFLLVLPERTDIAPVANGASEKQAALIESLWTAKAHGFVDSVKTAALADRKAASALIDHLFKAPKVAVVATEVPLPSGIYAVGTDVYKVYWNQGKTHMLAKRLEVTNGSGSWTYAGAAARFVKAEQQMTLAQAKEFGAIYGVCCNCGATLTDETSIEAGIGPVCAKRFAA
jgi:hypothetical protein